MLLKHVLQRWSGHVRCQFPFCVAFFSYSECWCQRLDCYGILYHCPERAVILICSICLPHAQLINSTPLPVLCFSVYFARLTMFLCAGCAVCLRSFSPCAGCSICQMLCCVVSVLNVYGPKNAIFCQFSTRSFRYIGTNHLN